GLPGNSLPLEDPAANPGQSALPACATSEYVRAGHEEMSNKARSSACSLQATRPRAHSNLRRSGSIRHPGRARLPLWATVRTLTESIRGAHLNHTATPADDGASVPARLLPGPMGAGPCPRQKTVCHREQPDPIHRAEDDLSRNPARQIRNRLRPHLPCPLRPIAAAMPHHHLAPRTPGISARKPTHGDRGSFPWASRAASDPETIGSPCPDHAKARPRRQSSGSSEIRSA